MSISESIRRRIKQMAPGQVFGYGDIPEYQNSPDATVKTVSRLFKLGEINRLSKGRFYKPQKGISGDLKPSDSELLKTILYKDGKLRGYIVGAALYNQLGLTTQVPRIITVAVDGSRQQKDFGTLRAKLVKSRAPVKVTDVVLLQYLDVLRNINTITGTDANSALRKMVSKLAGLNAGQVKRIQSLAIRYYTAATRAILGLALEYNKQPAIPELKASLNRLSQYSIPLDTTHWLNTANWNIKTNARTPVITQRRSKTMDTLVEQYRLQILSLAKQNGVRNVRVFGSRARDDANLNSDLDLLVDIEDGRSGLALGGFLADVSELVQRKVDVVTEKSLHPSIREKVLHEAKAL